MKLKGKNFQPWPEFEMDIDKLTVLVGPSNKGKSSLFRALRGVLRNDLPADYIRNKQSEPLEVEIEHEGHTYKAVRAKKGTVNYIIDNDDKHPLSSLGGKTPEQIEKLNFGTITIGSYELDPIFAEQNRAQFLIDTDRWKPTELNAILGAFASTEKLDAGKKEANARISQKNGEAKTLAAEIREAEERKAKLTELSLELDLVEGQVNTLDKEARKAEAQTLWVKETMTRQKRVTSHEQFLVKVTLPDLDETTVLHQQVAALTQASESLVTSKWLRKVATFLDGVATEWSELAAVYRQLRAAQEVEGLLEKKQSSTETYVNKLTTLVGAVNSESEEALRLYASIKYLLAAKTHYEAVINTVPNLQYAEDALSDAREEVQELNKLLAAEEMKKQPGLCPKCGKSLEHICG